MNVVACSRWVCTAALACALFPAAAAAAPGSLGTGSRPHVAMDAAGTAYIAWNGIENSGPNTLYFCRLPRGGTACQNPSTVVSTTGNSLSQPFVAVDGATVRIVSYRYGGDVPNSPATYVFTSVDSGNAFDAGAQAGSLPIRDAVFGPGAGFSLVTSAFSGGGVYQRVEADATPKATTSAQLSTTHVYEGAVGLADAITPVVTYTDGSGQGKVWRCEGCDPAVKDPNDVNNWTGGADTGNADDAHFAGGPSGLFLKTSDSLTGGNLIVRKYAAGGFSPAVTIPGATGEHPQSHMSQDPGGRLHVVWPRIDADANRLWYATSDDGANWLTGAIHQGTELFYDVRTAAAPDHVGLAVWGTGGSASEIHYLPMGPTPPQPVPVEQTPTTPATPGPYSGPARPVRLSDRQATYTLTVPRNCVQPGQRFRVTLKWRRKKRKGNLFVKVRRSDFYLGTRVVRKDTRAPFVHTYTVLVTAPRGSTISLRARAFIKVRRGKAPKKSIRARVRVCA